MDYEFTFVVDGRTVDDDTAVSRLEDQLDAMLARAGGQNLLSVASSGDTAVEAALALAQAVRGLVPGLRLLRLDRDLVGIQEIAERTERSRQNVHQWVQGTRLADHEPFPAPEGAIGRGHVWLWTEVNAWLRQHGLDDGLAYPSRKEMTQIDFVLSNSLNFSFRSSNAEGYDAARKSVVEALEEHIVSFSEFVTGLPLEKSAANQHILAIAAPHESAHDVMRFIADQHRDVVLVTATDEAIVGVLFSIEDLGPQEIVLVPHGISVWEWMDLVRETPSATFVAEDAAPPEVPRVRHRQTMAFDIGATA
ncbi:hypothetical protein V2S66_27070 [Streptomyces sp. V4-01]|uniref:Transcriptional regulator n=1 Tax=Actinacidiphila polyblastidii TaxID=3110430 RepID=A0ABU7PIH1_9ACTN|nr:hypothetical protein [Streptomyces sp. V4-01]